MIRIARSADAPQSLVPRSRPFGDDVRAALDRDFLGKCYLCEGLASECFDVEHLRPVVDFPELEFDWQNLFLSHPRCNQRRKRWSGAQREPGRKSWPRGGLLDCCHDDVDGRLEHSLATEVGGVVVAFDPRDPSDLAASNTAAELNSIHDHRCFWGRQLLGLIDKRWRELLRVYAALLQSLASCGSDWDAPPVRDQLDNLRAMLDTRAPYAGLLRTGLRAVHDAAFGSPLEL